MTGMRRVVTGLDAEGRSCAIFDDVLPLPVAGARMIWRTDAIPARNNGTDDAAGAYDNALLRSPGSNFMVSVLPVGARAPLHATDTIDYVVVLGGRLVFELECDEVVLGAGDVIVDRGAVHGWRNDGPEPACSVTVTVPAHPLGAGATLV